MLRSVTRHIPNAITCMNLLSGCIGIALVSQYNFAGAAYCIIASTILDFMDGMAARLLKAHSPIGKDLDSLADVVSFGVLPAMIVFYMMHMLRADSAGTVPQFGFYTILPFSLAIFSALRLAIFNNDTTQTYNFKGLPTPANALFWASLSLVFFSCYSSDIPDGQAGSLSVLMGCNAINQFFYAFPFTFPALIVFMSAMLVLPVKLMSFKFSNFSVRKYAWHFAFLGLSAAAGIIFGFASAPIILLLYILFSFVHFRFN